jgi:hypothetical protein
MGDVILLFNTSRPQRLIELSNGTHMASRTLAEISPLTTAVPQLLYPEATALKCLFHQEKGTLRSPQRAWELWNRSDME